MVLAGAQVVYLDSYPLNEYSMYGAVPLREIKKTLLALKAEGKLERVRMLLLTNCTFDGIVRARQSRWPSSMWKLSAFRRNRLTS
jgi:arginine decarboxylase